MVVKRVDKALVNNNIERNEYMRRTIFDLMDSMFDDGLMMPVYHAQNRNAAPACNVLEDETAYTIQVAAPGLTKEEVSVKLDEDEALVISMQKKEEKREEEAPKSEETSESREVAKVDHKPVRYLRREFMHQSFAQRMLLPEDADKEKISAKMENGMLEVVIPKIKEEERMPIEKVINIG